MNRIITLTRMAALGIVLLSACKSSIEQPAVSRGLADFTKYVSIGNSLTAGYADGGLYLDGQLNSYPSIIATQLKAAGGGVFTQPLFVAGQENGSGYLKLAGFNPTTGVPIIVPVVTDLAVRGVSPLTGLSLYTKFTAAVNNLGVPGIRMSDLADSTYGAKNPYLERLETSAEVGVIGYPAKVLQAKPTFFTSWLGNNDALQFATSGGTYPPLTPVSTYAAIYAGFISKLVATGAKGVLGTIPNIALCPFFTTMTAKNIVLAAKATGAQVTAVYITTGTGTVRAATAADLIILTVDSVGLVSPTNPAIGPRGFSPYNPLKNTDVLDSAEVVTTENAINSYNLAITQIAAANKLGLMDVNALLNQVKSGTYVIDGIPLNLGYIYGGVFSLDGIHLTPRGYAAVANQYIQAINKAYNSTIIQVDPGKYREVKMP